jgi:hypothetical protein
MNHFAVDSAKPVLAVAQADPLQRIALPGGKILSAGGTANLRIQPTRWAISGVAVLIPCPPIITLAVAGVVGERLGGSNDVGVKSLRQREFLDLERQRKLTREESRMVPETKPIGSDRRGGADEKRRQKDESARARHAAVP